MYIGTYSVNYPCQDIAKEFVRSNDARCRVFGKI